MLRELYTSRSAVSSTINSNVKTVQGIISTYIFNSGAIVDVCNPSVLRSFDGASSSELLWFIRRDWDCEHHCSHIYRPKCIGKIYTRFDEVRLCIYFGVFRLFRVKVNDWIHRRNSMRWKSIHNRIEIKKKSNSKMLQTIRYGLLLIDFKMKMEFAPKRFLCLTAFIFAMWKFSHSQFRYGDLDAFSISLLSKSSNCHSILLFHFCLLCHLMNICAVWYFIKRFHW